MGHYAIEKKSSTGRGTTKRLLKSVPVPTIKDATPVKLEKAVSSDACTRCGGLLVSHWCMNVNYDAGGMEILTKRCLQCGEVIDPVILENRQHPEREAMKKKTRPLLSRPLASSKSKSAGMSCSPVA
jgi:RNase P subunit RPR2